jgi:hypothetical protein
VVNAHIKSSPLIVLRFSFWHLSLALCGAAGFNSYTQARVAANDLLACNETDEFRYTLLHSLFSVFRNLGIGWQSLFHDAAEVCPGTVSGRHGLSPATVLVRT